MSCDSSEIITPHYIRVLRFMQKAGQVTPITPSIPADTVMHNRLRLIFEEFLELTEAAGFALRLENPDEWSRDLYFDDFMIKHNDNKPDLVKIADGLADLSVVVTGTMIACGIQDNALLEEVDKNNLDKFAPGGYKDKHGKWIKPPNHLPPSIAKVLHEQGWQE